MRGKYTKAPTHANAPKRLRMTVCTCYISIVYAISQSLPTCISPQRVNFYSHISEASSLRTSPWPHNMMLPPPGGRTFPEPHPCVLMTIQVDMILHHLLPHRDRITASALHDFDCPHPYDKSLSHRMHHNDTLQSLLIYSVSEPLPPEHFSVRHIQTYMHNYKMLFRFEKPDIHPCGRCPTTNHSCKSEMLLVGHFS